MYYFEVGDMVECIKEPMGVCSEWYQKGGLYIVSGAKPIPFIPSRADAWHGFYCGFDCDWAGVKQYFRLVMSTPGHGISVGNTSVRANPGIELPLTQVSPPAPSLSSHACECGAHAVGSTVHSNWCRMAGMDPRSRHQSGPPKL